MWEHIFSFDFLGLFLFLAGFVIGLGAVVVIDFHGFFGRTSAYWTEATIRTHKITKPLIWTGIFLAVVGASIFYRNEAFSGIPLFQSCVAVLLIANGCFLSFSVSPFLLEREKNGKAGVPLEKSWQNKIMISLLISDSGWWLALGSLVVFLLDR